jgi:hypothetical protein
MKSRGTDPNITTVNILPLFQRTLYLCRTYLAVIITVIRAVTKVDQDLYWYYLWMEHWQVSDNSYVSRSVSKPQEAKECITDLECCSEDHRRLQYDVIEYCMQQHVSVILYARKVSRLTP